MYSLQYAAHDFFKISYDTKMEGRPTLYMRKIKSVLANFGSQK